MMRYPFLERRLSTATWTVCNTSLEDDKISEVPLWDNGMTFHHLGLILCAAFGLVAIACSLFLMCNHAFHYSKPREQRHIIRILFMVPIYCVVSFLSFLFYRKSVYFQILGTCYEAFAISAFFTLLCHYIAPDLHSQKDYFRGIRPRDWVWPLNWFARACGGQRGCWRTPRSGLTWFNVIWIGVFQYCFFRVAMTVVAVITQYAGRYCEASLSPAFSHIWVLVIESTAVSIAMYCLIQFYFQIRKDVAHHSPFLKILSIKLVIFLSFWQTTLISLLTSSGAIKSSNKVGQQDIQIGIPNLLIILEMSMFSILHLFSFSWKPYRLKDQQIDDDAQLVDGRVAYHGGFMGIRAFTEAFNPWDLVKAIGRGFRWLFIGYKKRTQDPSYMGQPGASFSLKPSASGPQTSMPGPHVTAYGGAGAGLSSGKAGRYGASDEEGEELLSHVQGNPSSSYPPHAGGDIGMASYYEEEPHSHNYGSRYEDVQSVGLRPVSPISYQPYSPARSPYQPSEDEMQGHDEYHPQTASGPSHPYPHGDVAEGIAMPSPRRYPHPHISPPPDYDPDNRL